MTQTDHVATLSRREGGEVGKRRAKDAVLFVIKRLMEELAYPMRARIAGGFIFCQSVISNVEHMEYNLDD